MSVDRWVDKEQHMQHVVRKYSGILLNHKKRMK